MKYSVAAAEKISDQAPVLFRGDLYTAIVKAKKMGYDALEIHLRSAKEVDGNKMSDYCIKHGFNISALATGLAYVLDKLSLIDDDDGVRQAAIATLKDHIDLSAKFGSSVIIGSMRGVIPDYNEYNKYELRLKEGLSHLIEYAEEKNVVLVLEAINRYETNFLNTIEQTKDFIDKIGSKLLKIHIDTFHMNIEDADMAQSIRNCKEKLGYVHFADSNRRYPGAGHIEFEKILTALKDVGYEGYVSMECLPYPDPDKAAEMSLKHIKSISKI